MEQKRTKGRPPTRGVPMTKVQTWLQPDHVEIVRQVGHGQVAVGLRDIVERYVAEHPAVPEQTAGGNTHD